MATKEMGIGDILHYQYSSLPITLTPADCYGTTYIVTGSNSGLGLECVKHLVKLGCSRVIMAVRSLERGQAALSAVEAQTGIKGVAEVWHLDLANFDSVKKFSAKVEQDLERVDGLLENAVAAEGSWVVAQGMESSITVNVVGTMLLAVLLMPYLSGCAAKFSCQPCIGIVTSSMAFGRQNDLRKIDKGQDVLVDVNNSSKWSMDGANRYSLSKLLQVLAVRRLARLAPVGKTGVVINLINPGLSSTGLVRYSSFSTKLIISTLRLLIGRSAEWGSRTLLHGMAAGEESHGKYLSYCEIKEEWVPGWVDDEEWAEYVWDAIAAELEKIQPGCVDTALNGGSSTAA